VKSESWIADFGCEFDLRFGGGAKISKFKIHKPKIYVIFSLKESAIRNSQFQISLTVTFSMHPAPRSMLDPPSPEASPQKGVSIVIPAYNEEGSIGRQIQSVEDVMKRIGWRYELIAVDDGSTDHTAEEAGRFAVRLISLPANRGYGGALKAGISAARYDWILIIDADGTYPVEAIPSLLEKTEGQDMVVGARIGENVNIPLTRRPAKWAMGRLASYLVERPIPDLNSGLRLIKKTAVERFEHLLPSGFSFTSTITLALLCNDYRVYYHPIDYHVRVGSSKFRASDAYQFLLLILRTVVYFNPLRVFLPLGAVLFFAGSAKFIYDVFLWNISQSAVLGILAGIMIWAVGLLADLVSRMAVAPRGR
jgi:glycosyltransferase involved in cell wall biosynthesis